MIFYVIVCIAIVLGVLVMTLIAISKGYAYKHSIDPLPDDEQRMKDNIEQDRTD
ncbi:YtzI protein [Virgibacillus ihumii]|uniref:YtzI protein n=1 Tax=Virgibacillus ihumii TaxID=2686091 RepID=UPI00157C9194|nr:YtzI protein [Virgibacillus ihumii]